LSIASLKRKGTRKQARKWRMQKAEMDKAKPMQKLKHEFSNPKK
jgi:hypothetical protein